MIDSATSCTYATRPRSWSRACLRASGYRVARARRTEPYRRQTLEISDGRLEGAAPAVVGTTSADGCRPRPGGSERSVRVTCREYIAWIDHISSVHVTAEGTECVRGGCGLRTSQRSAEWSILLFYTLAWARLQELELASDLVNKSRRSGSDPAHGLGARCDLGTSSILDSTCAEVERASLTCQLVELLVIGATEGDLGLALHLPLLE